MLRTQFNGGMSICSESSLKLYLTFSLKMNKDCFLMNNDLRFSGVIMAYVRWRINVMVGSANGRLGKQIIYYLGPRAEKLPLRTVKLLVQRATLQRVAILKPL